MYILIGGNISYTRMPSLLLLCVFFWGSMVYMQDVLHESSHNVEASHDSNEEHISPGARLSRHKLPDR